MYMPTALFSMIHLHIWICVKVWGHTLYIMLRICHNFGFTVYLLVASLSNPEFWYISLSLMMAHKAKMRLAIDVLVSFNIIRHWFFIGPMNLILQTLGFPLLIYFWVFKVLCDVPKY